MSSGFSDMRVEEYCWDMIGATLAQAEDVVSYLNSQVWLPDSLRVINGFDGNGFFRLQDPMFLVNSSLPENVLGVDSLYWSRDNKIIKRLGKG